MNPNDDILLAAHKHSIGHEADILGSDLCGCFHCLNTFSSSEIKEWIDEPPHIVGRTAWCPRCQIDAVIGSNSGYPITRDFLIAMQKRWFAE